MAVSGGRVISLERVRDRPNWQDVSAGTAQRITPGASLAIGCGPEAPSVGYSGSTLAVHQPNQVKVYRGTKPDRKFEELGTVDVSCPTAGQASPFGQVDIEGGCTYETAIQMAIEQAARSGADAIFSINTSAGGNGSIVSLTAVAIRFTGEPAGVETVTWPTKATAAPAKDKPAQDKPAQDKSTPEERLKRLKQMVDDGLISPDDYATRKSEILKEL
jgi:hypothetical protein